MLSSEHSKVENELQALENELRSKNRFFPQGTILSYIDKVSFMAKHTVPKGTKVYRCRLISKAEEDRFLAPAVTPISDELMKCFPQAKDIRECLNMLWAKGFVFDGQGWKKEEEALKKASETAQDLVEKNAPFYGYDEKESDAPPVEKAKAGRINPEGIVYLYAAKDVQTAILETRPVPTQYVSVAEIEMMEDMNLFSFINMPVFDDGKNSLTYVDYGAVGEYFSRPNYSDQSYYLATQYISEYIKNMKSEDGNAVFDGMCFKSSLNPEGVNYVFFDTNKETRKYKILNSALYQVKDLMGNREQIFPWK